MNRPFIASCADHRFESERRLSLFSVPRNRGGWSVGRKRSPVPGGVYSGAVEQVDFTKNVG